MEPLRKFNQAWDRNSRSVLTVFTLVLAVFASIVALQNAGSKAVDVTQQKQIDALGTALDKQRDAGSAKGVAPVVPSSQEIKNNPTVISIPGKTGEPGKTGPGPSDAQVQAAVVNCFADKICKGPGPTASQVALAVSTYCNARNQCTPKPITPKPGKDGTPGVNGQNGTDGQNATDAQVIAAVASFCGADSQPCKGKDGTDGKNGTNGTDGQNGQNGQDGTNGTDGKNAYPFTFEFTFTDALMNPVHMVCLVSDPDVATMCAQQ
jgi:hypothetical protein